MENISFKEVEVNELGIVVNFIREIAKYEKMLDEVKVTEDDLKEVIFNRKLANVILLLKNNEPIGFALYYFNFSTFTGKIGIHLEDFFIYENERHKGYGKLLFKEVVKVAKSINAPRMEWTCLKRNKPSIEFYKKMHANSLDEWHTFRLVIDDYDLALNS